MLDTTTQVLDLSYNNFGKIRESVFRERNLYNLQKIFLHHCGISMVVGRCFEGITNLVEVDLSRNLLNNVPKEALRDCGYLMVLNLRGNPIRQVPGDSFLKLQELQTRREAKTRPVTQVRRLIIKVPWRHLPKPSFSFVS